MIRVEELFYRYDRKAPDVLRGVSLAFAEGAHTALIGPNGCGKTTLIKHLNALLFPTAGSVSVDGMKTIDTASVLEIRRRVDDCLNMVGMTGLEKRAPHTLSGGEKRLLSIAGVLAMDPRYIAFDEPTAYLDPAGKQRVLDIIRRLHREGMAIIHIAHDMRDVAGADRIVVMDQGAILIEGTPAEVFGHAELLESVGLDIPAGIGHE